MPNGRGFETLIDRTFPVLLPSERVHHNDTRTCLVRGKPGKAKLGVGFRFVVHSIRANPSSFATRLLVGSVVSACHPPKYRQALR